MGFKLSYQRNLFAAQPVPYSPSSDPGRVIDLKEGKDYDVAKRPVQASAPRLESIANEAKPFYRSLNHQRKDAMYKQRLVK